MTTTEPSPTDLQDVLDELRALRETVDAQQNEIASLRAAKPARRVSARPSGDKVPATESGPVSRRAWLGMAGAGVAGAAVLGSASPAAAADGETVLVGGEYESESVTKVTSSSTTDAALHGVAAGAGVAIAGPANAIKGETTAADNGAHTIQGNTAGTGHAIAGVTTNAANTVATTWGRGGHLGAAVEGEQIATQPIGLAQGGNAVKGIIYTGPKNAPLPSPNHSHAIEGVTTGGGHAVAGNVPANADSHDATGSNKVASTWGKHAGRGPGVEGEQVTAETVTLAGGANAVKGIIFTGSKSAPAPSANHSHAVLGLTYGGGHAVAGDVPATAPGHDGVGLNRVASTWGKHAGIGPGVEGEQVTTETVALAGGANAVKGIIFTGPKNAPTGSANGSHGVLGITYGAGHSVAGDTPAEALGPNGEGVNTVAATWGRHKGTGAGIGGISVGGYGGEFQGGVAQVRLIPTPETSGAPTTGTHQAGELYMDDEGSLFLCTVGGEPGSFQLLNAAAGDGPTLLTVPERAYDSRPSEPGSGPKGLFGAKETRTIDLSADTSLPAGAVSAIVNLTVTGTSAAGFASIYTAAQTIAAPAFSTINWFGKGQANANTTTVAISDGQVKVYTATPTHVIVDVIGYHAPTMDM